MKVIYTVLLIFITSLSFSQEITNVKDLKPTEKYDNIHIQKLDTDSNSTSFVIWIKKSVKSHKHEHHSEVLYIIEGEGKMTIGNKTNKIKTGDYFRIPKNTYHSLKVTSKKPVKVISVQAPEFFGKDRVFEEK